VFAWVGIVLELGKTAQDVVSGGLHSTTQSTGDLASELCTRNSELGLTWGISMLFILKYECSALARNHHSHENRNSLTFCAIYFLAIASAPSADNKTMTWFEKFWWYIHFPSLPRPLSWSKHVRQATCLVEGIIVHMACGVKMTSPTGISPAAPFGNKQTEKLDLLNAGIHINICILWPNLLVRCRKIKKLYLTTGMFSICIRFTNMVRKIFIIIL